MDLVYLTRSGENEELRHSLRSVAGYESSVWIIGDPPGWVAPTVSVVRQERLATSGQTTHAHLLRALDIDAISDPFVLMNDDFYRLNDAAVPDWHRGEIRTLSARLLRTHGRARAGRYVAGMMHVGQRLRDNEGIVDPVSFEYHAPLIVHKAEMRYALLHAVTHKRTYYGNIAVGEGLLSPAEHPDVLVLGTGDLDPSAGWAATTDTSWRRSQAARRIRTMYANPSRFEAAGWL